MNERQTPSKLWSVVGIALPALAAIFSFIAAFTTQQRAIYLCIGVVFAGSALLAVQRVYAVFGQQQSSDDVTSPSGDDSLGA